MGGSSVTEKEGGWLVVQCARALFRIYTTGAKTHEASVGGEREQVVLQVVFCLTKGGDARGEGIPRRKSLI